jgi:surface antigen
VLLTSSVSTASPVAASVAADRLPHGPGLVRTVATPAPVAPVATHRVAAAAVARPAVAPTVRRTPVVRHVAPTATAPVRAAAPKPKPAVTTRPVSQTAQPSGTDDYPYRDAVGNPSDPWGFTERQCVSFAAWRLAQHGRTISNSDNWGSALTWDDTARRLGDTVTRTARVGAIAQWNADESSPYYGPGSATANGTFVAGGYGHVGWVKAVYSDGSALVEQYNMGGNRSYSVMRVKAPRYLLIG